MLGAILALLFIGCTKAPITGRNQLIMIDRGEEMKLGYQSAQQVLKKEKISNDRQKTAMVKKVGKRIAKISNQKNFKWEFYLIDNEKQANAFCLPGGKIFVFTGIFKYMKSDDELAAVMGHEIGHALARHGAERKSSATLSRIGAGIMKALNEVDKKKTRAEKDADNKNTDYMVNRWIMLPHSRTHEYEADHIGLVLSAKAGYDPRGALSFWKKFSAQKSTRPEYLSTHPTPIHRIEKIEELLPSVMPYYEASQKRSVQKIEKIKPFIPSTIPFFKD